MNSAEEKAFLIVKKLVDDFRKGEKYFLSKDYQEAEVRKDFIDKFFIALGWDVHHNEQKNPYEQEVKVEKGVSMSGAQKRADYSFALAPNFRDPKFFVEAKKPSQDLYDEDYYFQTVRYGWHKATPLAVLTDFEEFHILDCRFSPVISGILERQVKGFHYSDYADSEKFSEIYWLFSREAVAAGSLEKRAAELPKPKGKGVGKLLREYENRLPVDEDFLREIELKREQLAKIFKKADEKLSSEELTEAVQKTIDRLVFIRFLEDKLIEQEHYVHTFGEKGNAWHDFISLCKKLDAKYNGIVFKKSYIDSPEFNAPSSNDFRAICLSLCHLHSRFLFNEIPVHILGSIYERFLGKTIHATPKRVLVEEKPEVRKAGGVFYTPQYIVDYIVSNTVGKQIEGKTPEQIAKLRFADIACGSGSFLIGVFDCLLNYHNRYYQQNPKEAKKAGCHFRNGIWTLSIRQKQAILRNNIFGVDIDHQAVEVTQLSLSLKMLEDETTATANEMQALFHEKILPDMSRNIVCGNSLIAGDYKNNEIFAEDERQKLNVMDFNYAFPQVFSISSEKGEMYLPDENDFDEDIRVAREPRVKYEIAKRGGFDAIVGNPPYVRIQVLQDTQPDAVEYFKKKYASAVKGNFDIYVLFIEKAFRLLNANGIAGFIQPHKFFQADFGVGIRKFLSDNSALNEIVHFGVTQIFKGATTYTCLLFFDKKRNNKFRFVQLQSDVSPELALASIQSGKLIQGCESEFIPQPKTGDKWNFTNNVKQELIEKIKDRNKTVVSLTEKVFQGIPTGADNVFILKKITAKKSTVVCFSNQLDENVELETAMLKPFLLGRDVKRYEDPVSELLILFPYVKKDGVYKLMDSDLIEKNYPLAWNYFLANKNVLSKRENYRFRKTFWQYSRPQNLDEFESARILMPHIGNKPEISLDKTGAFLHTANVYSFKFNKEVRENEKYFLGILNSKLFWFFLVNTGTQLRGGYVNFKPTYINPFPVKTIDFSKKDEKSLHDEMVILVEKIMQAKKQIQIARTEKDKQYFTRRCEELDLQIDKLTFKIYNLNNDEIELIQGESR